MHNGTLVGLDCTLHIHQNGCGTVEHFLSGERCFLQAAQNDKTAAKRLEGLDLQLKQLKAEQAGLTKQWEKEQEEMKRLQSIKNEVNSRLLVLGSCHAAPDGLPIADIAKCLADLLQAPLVRSAVVICLLHWCI